MGLVREARQQGKVLDRGVIEAEKSLDHIGWIRFLCMSKDAGGLRWVHRIRCVVLNNMSIRIINLGHIG